MKLSSINLNRRGHLAVALLVLFGLTYLAGSLAGRYTLGIMVTERPLYSILLHRSARELFEISRMINSNSELTRLSGYYGLYENNMVETKFLVRRLEVEPSPIVRRTIIWILGYSKDRNMALEALKNAFESGNPLIRAEVLSSMKRLDPVFALEFSEKNK